MLLLHFTKHTHIHRGGKCGKIVPKQIYEHMHVQGMSSALRCFKWGDQGQVIIVA